MTESGGDRHFPASKCRHGAVFSAVPILAVEDPAFRPIL
jgi:hypothetical protein